MRLKSDSKEKKDRRPSFIRIKLEEFKRWQETEKEKKAFKRQNINRSIKPQGYFARKMGAIAFWILFTFMFLVVMVTIFSDNELKQATTNEVVIEENYATSAEALQFAMNFARDYFTWTDSNDGVNQRIENMARYMPETLRNNVGTSIKNGGWNSTFKGAEIKQIKEKGKNLSQITFLVAFELTQNATIPPADSAQAQSAATSEAPTSPESESKTVIKYFVVPVIWDGQTFGVYELPKFSYIYENKTTLEEIKYEELAQTDAKVMKEIQEFLPAFFKSYAEDSKVELNYMILKEDVTNGLNGTMLFDSIKNLAAYKGEKENQFIVYTEVVFLDPETKMPFHTNYQLEITKNKDRLLVSAIDNQKYSKVVSKKDTITAEVSNDSIEDGDKEHNRNK